MGHTCVSIGKGTHGLKIHWNCQYHLKIKIRSDQISRSVVSDSLRPHESQYARPPCPSPTPRVHPDSRPSSQWCHPAISSSVIPFSSCPQSLSKASESFPMSQLFAWGGQSTGVSALASFLLKKSQGWSPSEWTGWIAAQMDWDNLSSPLPQSIHPESILSFKNSCKTFLNMNIPKEIYVTGWSMNIMIVSK